MWRGGAAGGRRGAQQHAPHVVPAVEVAEVHADEQVRRCFRAQAGGHLGAEAELAARRRRRHEAPNRVDVPRGDAEHPARTHARTDGQEGGVSDLFVLTQKKAIKISES